MNIKWGPLNWGRLPYSRADLVVQRDRHMQIALQRLVRIDTLTAENRALEAQLAEAETDRELQRRVVDRAREGRLRAEQQRNASDEECARLRQDNFDLRQRLSHSDQPRDEYGRYLSTGTQFKTAAEVLAALNPPTDQGAAMPTAAGDQTSENCPDCGDPWEGHAPEEPGWFITGCAAALNCTCTTRRPTPHRNGNPAGYCGCGHTWRYHRADGCILPTCPCTEPCN